MGDEGKRPLTAKPAGIEKPISKRARQRVNRKARLEKLAELEKPKKEKEEKFAWTALTGPAEYGLLAFLAGPEVKKRRMSRQLLSKTKTWKTISSTLPRIRH